MAFLSGIIKIRRGREADLQVAVASAGPVTAVVDSRHNTFQVHLVRSQRMLFYLIMSFSLCVYVCSSMLEECSWSQPVLGPVLLRVYW